MECYLVDQSLHIICKSTAKFQTFADMVNQYI